MCNTVDHLSRNENILCVDACVLLLCFKIWTTKMRFTSNALPNSRLTLSRVSALPYTMYLFPRSEDATKVLDCFLNIKNS